MDGPLLAAAGMTKLAAATRRAAASWTEWAAMFAGRCCHGRCLEAVRWEWTVGCTAAEHVRRARYCAGHDQARLTRGDGGQRPGCGALIRCGCGARAVLLARTETDPDPGLAG